jgi:hypothetical protein
MRYAEYGGGYITRCPRALLREDLWIIGIMRMYTRYMQHGRTPNGGGDLDQAAVFGECMELVGNMKAVGSYGVEVST